MILSNIEEAVILAGLYTLVQTFYHKIISTDSKSKFYYHFLRFFPIGLIISKSLKTNRDVKVFMSGSLLTLILNIVERKKLLERSI